MRVRLLTCVLFSGGLVHMVLWNQESWFEMQMSSHWSPPPLPSFPLDLSGWQMALTRVSHPESLNYFPPTHRTVTGSGGRGSYPSFSALYPRAGDRPETDCCFSSQWYFKAFSRAGSDSRGCGGHCSSGSDDSQPRRQTEGTFHILTPPPQFLASNRTGLRFVIGYWNASISKGSPPPHQPQV